jgi:hypothetical protein
MKFDRNYNKIDRKFKQFSMRPQFLKLYGLTANYKKFMIRPQILEIPGFDRNFEKLDHKF